MTDFEQAIKDIRIRTDALRAALAARPMEGEKK